MTADNNIELPADVVEQILNFRCPRYAEFPQVELYMDQVLQVLEQALAPFAPTDKEKLITSTMINNYVKHGIVSPPQKKRYNQNHLTYLMVVCVLKQVLPIADICKLIRLQIDACPIEQAYNYFCEVLEACLKAIFTNDRKPNIEHLASDHPCAYLVQTAALAVANKLYLQKIVENLPPSNKQ